IVPVSSWSGVNDAPDSTPTGARVGFSNAEREPTADVGVPGAMLGSKADGAAVCASACDGASFFRTIAPAVAAAPAITARRESRSSRVILLPSAGGAPRMAARERPPPAGSLAAAAAVGDTLDGPWLGRGRRRGRRQSASRLPYPENRDAAST